MSVNKQIEENGLFFKKYPFSASCFYAGLIVTIRALHGKKMTSCSTSDKKEKHEQSTTLKPSSTKEESTQTYENDKKSLKNNFDQRSMPREKQSINIKLYIINVYDALVIEFKQFKTSMYNKYVI